MSDLEKKSIKKIYLDKKFLKRARAKCAKRKVSINAYLTSEIKNLIALYRQNNLFFYKKGENDAR